MSWRCVFYLSKVWIVGRQESIVVVGVVNHVSRGGGTEMSDATYWAKVRHHLVEEV